MSERSSVLSPKNLEALMSQALDEARAAQARGEVPIGALIVGPKGELLAKSGNRVEELSDPTAHAELLVIREAAEKIGNWRLTDCTLVVTLEPCAMCAGALRFARLKRVVFGAADSRFGSLTSSRVIAEEPEWGPIPEVDSGVLEQEAKLLLQEFFQQLRQKD